MTSDSATNAVRPVTSNIACASRQRYTKYAVFWLACVRYDVSWIPAFCRSIGCHFKRWSICVFQRRQGCCRPPICLTTTPCPFNRYFYSNDLSGNDGSSTTILFFFYNNFCVFSFIQDFFIFPFHNNFITKNLYEVVFSFLQEFFFCFPFCKYYFLSTRKWCTLK